MEPREGTTGCTLALRIDTSISQYRRERHRSPPQRHACGAGEHRGPHDVARMARADADRARPHGAQLVGGALRFRNGLAGIRAERGVDAVERRVAGRERVDDGTRARHARERLGSERHLRVVARDAHDVGDADAAARERDRRRIVQIT